MTRSIEFFVPGQPRSKGSTRSFMHSKSGKVVTLGMSTSTRSWQARVASFAAQRWTGGVSDKPFHVTCVAVLDRPKSHCGTGRNSARLKDDAPYYPTGHNTGDVDKLLRAVLDGLTGVVFKDDSQVVQARTVKRYIYVDDADGSLGMLISVMEVERCP